MDDVRLAREALATPEGDLPCDPMLICSFAFTQTEEFVSSSIGVGFMGWKFEEPKMGKEAGAKEGDKWLSFIIHEAQARSIWISFANDLEYWVDRARRLESEPAQQTGATQRPRRDRLLIAVMVHSAEQAKAALTWDHLDAVILQGTEAGGHGADFQHGRPLAQLLDEVLPLRPSPDARPLVLAAGGISSPSAVSRQLAREGVAAVVCGTSFSVASESTLSDSQKDLLVRAEDGESGTARSGRWDVARGTTGWPEGVDGRGLRDAVSESTGEVQNGGAPVTWAGESGLGCPSSHTDY